MSDSQIDPDQFTRAGSITKDYYRDVYPTIDPTQSELSQTDKVTIVTGAGKGIGRVRINSVPLRKEARLTFTILHRPLHELTHSPG